MNWTPERIVSFRRSIGRDIWLCVAAAVLGFLFGWRAGVAFFVVGIWLEVIIENCVAKGIEEQEKHGSF